MRVAVVQDGIGHELAWSVPGSLATAVGFEDRVREVARFAQAGLVPRAADGVDGFVLQQQEVLSARGGEVLGNELVLQVERSLQLMRPSHFCVIIRWTRGNTL